MKKVASLVMAAIMCFVLATGCFADNAETVAVNPAAPISLSETQYYNEYDEIVAVRNEVNESGGAYAQAYIPEDRLEYIMSDAIEAELLYRASLPTEILKENYGYSDEAVAVLRNYDGSKIEDNPQLRAASATMRATLGILEQTKTKMGIIYTWSWDTYPLIQATDIAAMSWEGTYENGLSNNMKLDVTSTFVFVNYYNLYGIGGSGLQSQVRYDELVTSSNAYGLVSDNTNCGVGVVFPMLQSPGSSNWAKSGSMYVYMNLVNQSTGPLLYELNTHAEYAHYTVDHQYGVSFPAGLSISFSGSYSTYGIKNLTVRAK